jgi:hypothetical protein
VAKENKQMAKSAFGTAGQQISRSLIADVDLAAGLAVIAGAAINSVKLPTAANQRALGVVAVDAKAGQPVTLVRVGEVIAVADAAIARGDLVMINAATGKLAPVGAVAGTNYHVVGEAQEAAAAQNDEFLLFVVPGARAQG